MLSDLEIAQAAKLRPVGEIAGQLGLEENYLDLYGKYKAKVSLKVMDRLKDKSDGHYITVTAITPTPLGEGKTVTNIGLAMALNKIGKKAINTLREPSMGPVFGIKGGAAGGGYSQVVPMEDINLHFTGDIHAVGAANNLLAAFIDTHILKRNKLGIDPLSISWNRVVDISDRALRDIVVGLGGSANGAMCVLLKEALKPNLVQTLENTPCFMHTGPFANIAPGNNSVVEDKIALKLADYVVTESGFGADCGAEKLFNIKCRQGGLTPSAVVIAATVRALKMHGGGITLIPGKPVNQKEISRENVPAVEKGCENLEKQIENMRLFGLPVVVAINQFTTDTKTEIEAIKEKALKAGAQAAVISQVWAKGGQGGVELAEAVVEACKTKSEFKFLYPLDISIKEKIETIATKIYGADGVDYSPLAEKKIRRFTKQGLDRLPICMAKTHLSLSHDPNLKGHPRGFRVPIRDVRPSVGAGFLYPLCGEMRTMPGLPTHPAAMDVDIDQTGRTVGLF